MALTAKKSVNKSMSSRIRVTRTGKLMRRTMGSGHFRTRKSSKNIQSKRTPKTLGVSKHAVLSY
jgi:ribosomal protein L35